MSCIWLTIDTVFVISCTDSIFFSFFFSFNHQWCSLVSLRAPRMILFSILSKKKSIYADWTLMSNSCNYVRNKLYKQLNKLTLGQSFADSNQLDLILPIREVVGNHSSVTVGQLRGVISASQLGFTGKTFLVKNSQSSLRVLLGFCLSFGESSKQLVVVSFYLFCIWHKQTTLVYSLVYISYSVYFVLE